MSLINTALIKQNQSMLAEIMRWQISPLPELTSWQQVQHIVRAGLADKVFRIGDQFVAEFNGNPVPLDVIGINHDIPTDERYKYSLTLQTHNGLLANPGSPSSVYWAVPEALFYTESELSTGEYVFLFNGVKFKFTTIQTVPAGGQVVVSAWKGDAGDDRYKPTKITTYSDDRATAIDTNLSVTEGVEDEINLTPVNTYLRSKVGSNRYIYSPIKQFINSADSSFAWESKSIYGRPTTGMHPYTGAGFLYMLDDELVDVLGKVNKQVAKHPIDGTGQDAFSDKVFLLSKREVYGIGDGTVTGEKPYAYYSLMAPSPTDDVMSGRIKFYSDSARPWWLRSPNIMSDNEIANVRALGQISFQPASATSETLAPAFCIV